MFVNSLGDWRSISGRVVPKTQKMILDNSLLNTKHHKVKIQGKVEDSKEKKVTPTPPPQCSRSWKGSLQVALDYGHQLYKYIWEVQVLKQNLWVSFTFGVMTSHMPINSKLTSLNYSYFTVDQSAEAVEYIDCISAEGKDSHPSTSIPDMTLNNLMVRFQ